MIKNIYVLFTTVACFPRRNWCAWWAHTLRDFEENCLVWRVWCAALRRGNGKIKHLERLRTMTALAPLTWPSRLKRDETLKGNMGDCVRLLESWSFTVIRRSRRTRGSSGIQEVLTQKEVIEAKPHGGADLGSIGVQMTCSLYVRVFMCFYFMPR